LMGMDFAGLGRAADRARFYVCPIDERIIKNLQATADRFATLGLIPKPILVREAVRNALQS
jgi:sulfonate transport system substrate-binding protein